MEAGWAGAGVTGKSSSRLYCVGRDCMTDSLVGGGSRFGVGGGRLGGGAGGGVLIDSRRVDIGVGVGVGTLVGIGVGARVVDMDRIVEAGVRGVCG